MTAKHVVLGLKEASIDGKLILRINLRRGGSRFVETDVTQWMLHPDSSVDVAMINWVPALSEFDVFAFPPQDALPSVRNREGDIGLGDEVFITGLFIDHHGAHKNIPIIRIGNIAAMPEEPIETAMGPMEAYLIEARSIGGLSGSPVFVNLGMAEVTKTLSRPRFYLLGLVHGHFDARVQRDVVEEGALKNETVNTGIAIVVPISKALGLIRSEGERRQHERPSGRGCPAPGSRHRDITSILRHWPPRSQCHSAH